MRARSLASCILATWLLGCAGASVPPPESTPASSPPVAAGTVLRSVDGAHLTVDDLVAELSRSRLVLLGEKHDNPEHHRLQAHIIGALSDVPVGAAIEMLEADKQALIDAGPLTSADELARRVAWSESGWPEFGIYAPVFERLLEADARLVSAGIPRAQLMDLARGAPPEAAGLFAPDWAEAYNLDAPLPAAVAEELATLMQDAHCGFLPEGMVPGMVRVQRLRDAMMAEGLRIALASRSRAFLIAGGGHVRRDLGVPTLLSRVGLGDAVSVGMIEQAAVPTAEALREALGRYDFLVVTGSVAAEDHCKQLRAHFAGQGHSAEPKSTSTTR